MTHTAHGPDRMLAFGSSMFPCVPSGSVLGLRRATAADVVVGDIVVFVSSSGLCAHRLLAIAHGPAGKQLVVRGDAQKPCELIDEAALVFVVTHVAHRFLSYRTDSLFGRALARFARRRGFAFRLVSLLLSAAARLTPRRSAPVVPSSGVLSLSSARPSIFPEAPKSARDSMLRGLKHELRTPLNAILGFADLLLGELDGPLSDDERENVSVVRDAGLTLLGLINEVLDLATALMVPAEPVLEENDVVVLLEEVRHEIEQRAGMRPVHVGVESQQSQLELRVDARTLLRVLRALGDLALSATTAGGITLGAARKQDVLHVWIAADGFDAHAHADSREPEELALGPKRPHDRARRAGALRIAIVGRLLSSQGGSLTVQRVKDAHVLCVELPLRAAPSEATTWQDAPTADTSLALSYIASMSHDLRTPLNAILGFADLLTMSKRDAWSTAQLRSLDIVRERAVDLTALIDDMIDWAKLEAGELELQRELTAVLPIVERALAAATERSGGRGLSLSLHTDTPDAGKVWADASRCVQALLGLLENAIRANPGREVQVRLQRTAANVRIEIEDPGLEIRAEDHTGVFDAFRPSYAPTGQRIAGLQLGPSVARSLMRAHGGDVWFESRPGRGTTFTATLPVAAGAGLPGSPIGNAAGCSGAASA